MASYVCSSCSMSFKSKSGLKSHERRKNKCYYSEDTMDLYKDLENRVIEKRRCIEKINNNFINFPNSYKLMINKIVDYKNNNYFNRTKEDLRNMFLYGYDNDDENILDATVQIDKFYQGNDSFTSNYYYLRLKIIETDNICKNYDIGGILEGLNDGYITIFDFYDKFIERENIFDPHIILNDIKTCSAESLKIQIPKRYYVVFKPID